MIDWIYNGIKHHIENDDFESYRKLFVEKELEIKPSSDGVDVLSDVSTLMKISEDIHQQKISELRGFMKNIKDTKSYQSVKDFLACRSGIKQLREDIVFKLSQEIERSEYPGSCDYS